jgi:hypothetical protein
VVDALFRVGFHFHLNVVLAVLPVWIQEVVNSYHNDSKATALLQELALSSPNAQGYSLAEGVIRHKTQIWIGNNSALHTKRIATFHTSTLGWHSGIQATYQRLKKVFYWPGMKQEVESYVRQCRVCQQAKPELCKYPGLLDPLPIPQQSWADISMDFIEGLPKCNGFSVILVIVDRFTKYAHFFPVKHPYSAASIAQLFLDNIVKLHGVPKSVVSDRDKVFTNSFWTELFKLLNTDLKFCSAYHPQSDGQTERVNQCLEMYLCCVVQATPTQWHKWLSLVELWYNTSFHSSLQCSPFKAMYATDPHPGLFPHLNQSDHTEVTSLMTEKQYFTRLLNDQLAKAQNRMTL